MCGRIIEILETEIRRNLIYNKQHFPENVCKKINLVVKSPVTRFCQTILDSIIYSMVTQNSATKYTKITRK